MPGLGAGILGVLQHTAPVALLLKALWIGENARHHAGDGVRHDHGRQFSAGEYEVTDGEFLIHTGLDKPFVDPFVVSADED